MLISKPIAQLESAIQRLGEGIFDMRVSVRGPADWNRSDGSSTGCGCGSWTLKSKNRDSFATYHMSSRRR
jgi:hypothetical protein